MIRETNKTIFFVSVNGMGAKRWSLSRVSRTFACKKSETMLKLSLT